MTIQIEKGVPIPGGNKYKYPWREMEVGDSFFVAGKTSATLNNSRVNAQKSTRFKFKLKNVEGGVRVWRVA